MYFLKVDRKDMASRHTLKKIGYVSDLHTDLSNIRIEDGFCDILVIAGDLAVSNDLIVEFFYRYAPKNIPIIYVMGNHEFEGRVVGEYEIALREQLREFPNVFLLQNESVVIDGIKFIGSTLWTGYNLCPPEKRQQVMENSTIIPDFKRIKVRNNDGKAVNITPDTMSKLFDDSYEFLCAELMPDRGIKTVVVTHFAPHKDSVAARYAGANSDYWVNHMPELMGYADVWIHGHTHNSFEYKVGKTSVVCNPRGYAVNQEIPENFLFDKVKVIEV